MKYSKEKCDIHGEYEVWGDGTNNECPQCEVRKFLEAKDAEIARLVEECQTEHYSRFDLVLMLLLYRLLLYCGIGL